MATPLFAVLVVVEVTDIIFAVDSIPAIFAVTAASRSSSSANAFAILGLRAMYFLLADMIHRFIYLKVGLGGVLVFVGIKMVLTRRLQGPTIWLSLAVIATSITVAVVWSLRATRDPAPTSQRPGVHRAGR